MGYAVRSSGTSASRALRSRALSRLSFARAWSCRHVSAESKTEGNRSSVPCGVYSGGAYGCWKRMRGEPAQAWQRDWIRQYRSKTVYEALLSTTNGQAACRHTSELLRRDEAGISAVWAFVISLSSSNGFGFGNFLGWAEGGVTVAGAGPAFGAE